jgi:hypothetical protein
LSISAQPLEIAGDAISGARFHVSTSKSIGYVPRMPARRDWPVACL